VYTFDGSKVTTNVLLSLAAGDEHEAECKINKKELFNRHRKLALGYILKDLFGICHLPLQHFMGVNTERQRWQKIASYQRLQIGPITSDE
jgi:hypothetical protein